MFVRGTRCRLNFVYSFQSFLRTGNFFLKNHRNNIGKTVFNFGLKLRTESALHHQKVKI